MVNKLSKREFDTKMRRAPDEEIVSLIGGQVDKIVRGTSLFITRGGDIIDVRRATVSTATPITTHEDYITALVASQTDLKPETFSFDESLADTSRAIENRGWLRMGTGSNVTDNIYYIVLPDYRAFTPTAFQYDAIEDFINMAYLQRRRYVIIYFSPYDLSLSKTFFFEDYEPEDLMRIIRRYYSSGRIHEGLKRRRGLNEAYTNKGESKKDFTAITRQGHPNFMHITKQEYPNFMQGHASYWDRRNKK